MAIPLLGVVAGVGRAVAGAGGTIVGVLSSWWAFRISYRLKWLIVYFAAVLACLGAIIAALVTLQLSIPNALAPVFRWILGLIPAGVVPLLATLGGFNVCKRVVSLKAKAIDMIKDV